MRGEKGPGRVKRTMKVRIRTFATFKDVFGDTNEVGVGEEGTVLDALHALCRVKGGGSETLFSQDGSLLGHVILAVNGVRIEPSDAGRTPLGEGDTIAAYPPVSGG